MSFGFRKGSWDEPPPGVRLLDAGSQEKSLQMMHEVVQRAAINPDVVFIAKQIAFNGRCDSRDDMCELEAVFDAVKVGDPRVGPLKTGIKYVRDPRFADYFTSPIDMLRNCQRGACAGDCDDHAMMIVALLGALGWKAGLRAYGESPDGFSHVYAVVAYPKLPTHSNGHLVWREVVALDTTVPKSHVGWEPPKANVLTAWLE